MTRRPLVFPPQDILRRAAIDLVAALSLRGLPEEEHPVHLCQRLRPEPVSVLPAGVLLALEPVFSPPNVRPQLPARQEPERLSATVLCRPRLQNRLGHARFHLLLRDQGQDRDRALNGRDSLFVHAVPSLINS